MAASLPVCASLDSSCYCPSNQDLRHVSLPLGEGHKRLERILKSGTMGKGRETWTFPAVSQPVKATQFAYSTSITSNHDECFFAVVVVVE